ncbi:unnamed protein product, partial [Rotaria sp. Silwood1]
MQLKKEVPSVTFSTLLSDKMEKV